MEVKSDGGATAAIAAQWKLPADDRGDQELSLECSYTSSAVKVEISDFNDLTTSFNTTTCALRKCKQQVLRPYWRLLILVAWRGIGKDSVHRNCWRRLLNIVYSTLVFLLILYAYVYNVMTCEWKLDVKADIKESTFTSAHWITTADPLAPIGISLMSFNSSAAIDLTSSIVTSGDDGDCAHIFTTYMVPNVVHLIAFLIGFYYFRIQENELLYALMEKVFLDASSTQGRSTSQQKLIKKLRLLLIFGALWVVLTIVAHGLFALAYGVDRQHPLNNRISSNHDVSRVLLLWILFVLQLISVTLVNCVNLAVILNYATQCEILIFYMRSVGTRVTERSVDLKTATKDVLSVRESLGTLNGAMARMTALALVRLFELFIMGITILFLNEDMRWTVMLYRVYFVIVWGCIAVLPLVQATRLNSACNGFRKVALLTRVFGHPNSSTNDLDSFLLFMSNVTLRAKLFHVPVRPGYFVPFILAVGFVLFVLLQADLLHGPNL